MASWQPRGELVSGRKQESTRIKTAEGSGRVDRAVTTGFANMEVTDEPG